MFARTLARLTSWFRRRRTERELDEELRFHLEMETQTNRGRGLPESVATRQALIDLGGVEQTRLAVRDVHGTISDSVLQDLSYGARRLLRRRSAALPAVLTVALAVGLGTAVWSVARAILIRPFAYAQPDRLLAVWKATPEIDFFPLSVPELFDVKDGARSVHDVGGFAREGFVLIAPTGARWVDAFTVTTNFLDVLGVRVIGGRTLRAEDGERGHGKVVVLSESVWREAFRADPGVIGRVISMKTEGSNPSDPDEYRVVGIVASDVEIFYPNHLRAQLYVPRLATAADRSEEARRLPSLITVARLRPGVPVRDGVNDVAAVLAASVSEHKATSFPGTPRVLPLHEELVGRTRPAFLLLTAASALLLLIGCANVANLVLANGLSRRREFAARLALGCTRARLLRQLLTEHILLASAGGLLGVALAAWVTPVLRRLAPVSLPRAADIRMDLTGLAAALALSTLAWLSSGLAPATMATRGMPLDWNASGGRTVRPGSRRLRSVLIFTQTALVLTLLGAAGLLVNGIWRLMNVDLGFQPGRVLVAQIELPESWWSEANARTARVERELTQRLAADSRFDAVTMGSELPFTWGVLDAVKEGDSSKPVHALVAAVGPDYLPLLGIRLRSGRRLDARDDGNKHVVVINDALQRGLSRGSGVGQRLLIDGEWREVVGLVDSVTEIGDVSAGVIRRAGLKRVTLPAAYVPIGSIDCASHFLLCRTTMDAATATQVVTKVLSAIQSDGTVRRSGWLSDRVDVAGAEIKFCALVVGVFALAALMLGAIGVFSVLAHAIRERTVEIGIRTALGASPARVRWTLASGPLTSAALGGAIGTGVVLIAGRALRAFLFEVPPNDPATLIGAALLLAIVAALAAYLPARSITRLDAARALRTE
jgi:putative ABC transport system permease protein